MFYSQDKTHEQNLTFLNSGMSIKSYSYYPLIMLKGRMLHVSSTFSIYKVIIHHMRDKRAFYVQLSAKPVCEESIIKDSVMKVRNALEIIVVRMSCDLLL